jgi:hypothetical protein
VSDREFPNRRWCGAAPVLADEVMGDWVDLIQCRSPWSAMPLDDMTGEFRAVLEELLEPVEALTPELRAARLRFVSRAHGAFRRRQGCPPHLLQDDVAFAGEAIEVALMRNGAATAVIMTIHDSLVAVLGAIERATLSGYTDHPHAPPPEH